jgi:Plasmid pRiA4b ORF-3-like protein/SEC-C motif
MKAYILKLSFVDMTPLIWRRVILPADATFHRLHQTIQSVTNFQSTSLPYHSFSVGIDDYYITDNEHLREEYKGKKFAGKTVKASTGIKIDSYLEKRGEFLYTYDFGDDWRIRVELEEIVEDYYFGYPTLLDGEGTAPPEDVGGPPGYESFLEIYHDPKHPDYLHIYSWAEEQYYRPLDIEHINERLKYVKYKKTEWQLIDHDNYHVLSDKYRGEVAVDLEKVPNKELIVQYAIACTNLYGLISYPKLVEIYNAQNELSITSDELEAVLTDANYASSIDEVGMYIQNRTVFHEVFAHFGGYYELLEKTMGKPFYIPEKEELLRYADGHYYEKTSHQEKLAKMLAKDFFGGSTLMVQEEIDELILEFQADDANLQKIIQGFFGRFECKDEKQLNEYAQALFMISNSTRIWENRGHTPSELGQLARPHQQPLPTIPFQMIEGGKVGRNEPCPCGSGKKYKKCCGK